MMSDLVAPSNCQNGPNVPEGFVCALSGRVMRDPVVACDGQVYDRSAFEEWLRQGNRTSPVTGCDLVTQSVREQPALRLAIGAFLKHTQLERDAGLVSAEKAHPQRVQIAAHEHVVANGLSPRVEPAISAMIEQTVLPTQHESLTACLDHEGRTMLIFAASEGHLDALWALLDQGVPVDQADACGCTAIIYAASRGHGEAVQLLLGAGADPNAASSSETGYFTALAAAATGGHTEAVSRLLEAGASVDELDAKGWSPLMHAACGGRAQVVGCLLAASASTAIADAEGRTALALAASHGDLQTVRVLVDAQPQCTSAVDDEAAGLALHCAAALNHAEVVRILLRTAIPPPMRAAGLRLALQRGHHEIVETLVRQANVSNMMSSSRLRWR